MVPLLAIAASTTEVARQAHISGKGPQAAARAFRALYWSSSAPGLDEKGVDIGGPMGRDLGRSDGAKDIRDILTWQSQDRTLDNIIAECRKLLQTDEQNICSLSDHEGLISYKK